MYQVNNIYNEDCYKAIKNLPDKCIDLVYIDIPYLIESGGSGESEVAKRIHKVNKEYLKDINAGIDYSILDELCRVMKTIYIYIWCSKEQILDLMKYIEEKIKELDEYWFARIGEDANDVEEIYNIGLDYFDDGIYICRCFKD